MYCKYIIKKAFKNYVIFEGGREPTDYGGLQVGWEGGLRPPKLDYVSVECSLTPLKQGLWQ